MELRQCAIQRKTGETDISVSLNLDGQGTYEIDSGIGFFDHMLSLMTKHGLLDMKLEAVGDLNVDSHHTVEDIGIVIGQCIAKALGDKAGIKRYGTSLVPMDEAMASVNIDISGRPFLVFNDHFTCDKLGDLDCEMVEEFFRAVAFNVGITLHCNVLYGKNNHHMAEALFKAFGRALRKAVEKDERIKGVMSTKGIL
ncbi:MAG: hisB [Clostridiaceae bacterium]|jgi:imidazoleglycerol-phosphate dehydratase|nr:hisB [Clostridiaceae bacterium]